MLGQHTNKFFGAGLLVFAIVATGCGPEMKRLRDERNALFSQNQEAQDLIDDLRRANDALNMENATLRSDLSGAVTMSDETAFDDVGGGVTATATDQAVTVSVPGDLLFAPGKVALNTASQSTLASIASIIESEYPGRRIRVEGYTDTDPIKKSGWDDNLQLSLERSAAVYRYLEDQGLPAELMYAAGFGAQKAKETKELSRRVEIVVILAGE
ncbi:MAG: OmpA family protein [Planctomycetota bacterium]